MIFINGQEINNLEVDSTLFFGRGLFETIHVKEEPIFLTEHVNRINSASKILKINRAVNENEVRDFIKNYNINNVAFKITVTEKSIIYSTREIPYTESSYEKGFNVGVSSVLRNSTSKLTYIKSTCYIENLLEKQQGETLGYNEMLFLNENGYITEGCNSNIFFFKDGKIHTPKVQCGLLDGIIRQWIINNFQVEQGEYSLRDLEESEGIVLTNSLMGIMKVRKLNGIEFCDNENIDKISKAYREFIKEII